MSVSRKILKKILPSFLTQILKKLAERFELYRSKTRVKATFGEISAGSLKSTLRCSIAYNKYGGYCIPFSSHHRPVAQTIIAGNVWEPETIEWIFLHYKGGDIIHAGTYFGDFLPALSKCCGIKGEVWAFEPNLENYKCAFVTKYINNLANVKIRNTALGVRRSSLMIKTKDADGIALGGASRIICQNSSLESTLVSVVTIDDIFPLDRKVAVFQLDIEGFEQQALSGALETIRRCKPVIIIETVPEKNWLSKHILELGYEITATVNENTVLQSV